MKRAECNCAFMRAAVSKPVRAALRYFGRMKGATVYERILVVCTGNICRSPLAAAMLRLQLPTGVPKEAVQVQSAGTRALVGQPTDETVLYVAREHPLLLQELQQHRAQQINSTLLWWADLVLIMERAHLRQIARIDPLAHKKTWLLGHWLGKSIADPYLKHELDYRDTHGLISDAVLSWCDKMNT